MIDPEEARDRRRESQPKTTSASSATSVLEQTQQMLDRWRADDPLADARRWLARHRSDRRTVDEIATEEGRTVAEVWAGIERARAKEAP
jgi:predicted transcriptional regulator